MVPRAWAATDGWMLMSFPSGSRKGKATNESYQHKSPGLPGATDHIATEHRKDCTGSCSIKTRVLCTGEKGGRPEVNLSDEWNSKSSEAGDYG